MSVDELRERGNGLIRSGDVRGAIASYTDALKVAPKDAKTLGNRAIAYLRVDEPRAALRDADAALAVEPQNAKAFSNRGTALLKIGRARAAVAAFEKGLAVDSSSANMRSNLEEAQKDAAFEQPFPSVLLPLAYTFLTLVYILPLGPESYRAYYMALLVNLAMRVAKLARHGRPSMNQQYLAKVMGDADAALLFFPIMYYSMGAYLLALLSLGGDAFYASALALYTGTGAPATLAALGDRIRTALGAEPTRKSVSARLRLAAAVAEAALAILIAVEVLTPRRNLIGLLLLYQLLPVRYFTSKYAREAWTLVHNRIRALLPGALLPMFDKLAAFLHNQANAPMRQAEARAAGQEQGAAGGAGGLMGRLSQAASGCEIM